VQALMARDFAFLDKQVRSFCHDGDDMIATAPHPVVLWNRDLSIRTFMRRYEKFSGCRVLSYCLMDTHSNCCWR
jgi:hypothetical protein